jgi:hypothetical protein
VPNFKLPAGNRSGEFLRAAAWMMPDSCPMQAGSRLFQDFRCLQAHSGSSQRSAVRSDKLDEDPIRI